MTHGARIAAWVVFAAAVAALGACLPTSEPGLGSRDPAMRLDAMATAAATKDKSAVPGLIQRLDSQDGGERLLAIEALERITGERHGYDHAGPAAEREAGVQRWRDWALAQGLIPQASAGSVR
jgi:HEAT repeat protein